MKKKVISMAVALMMFATGTNAQLPLWVSAENVDEVVVVKDGAIEVSEDTMEDVEQQEFESEDFQLSDDKGVSSDEQIDEVFADEYENYDVILMETENTYGDIKYTVSGTNITITGCDTSVISIAIPAQIDGMDVTAIDDYAFSGCRKLKDITIPDSITTIGDYAFQECSALTNVSIPKSVTNIGRNAFYGCNQLIEITLPFVGISRNADSIFYGKPSDGGAVFGRIFGNDVCDDTVQISQFYNFFGRETIAFSIPKSLQKVTITDVSYLPYGAFSGCNNLQIFLPDNLTSIGTSAFEDCKGLTTIDLPNNIVSIGKVAFRGCSDLSYIRLPDGLTSIGDSSFGGCTSLSTIHLPSSVTSIEYGAFDNCSSLTSISIPNGVTSISGSTFSNCSSLININIPNNVTQIGYSAFSGCSSLTSIDIPNSITTIDSYAFHDCSSLTSISIPNNIIQISDSTFNGCSSLTSVNIPNGVTTIGVEAFGNCSSLTSINVPNSVTQIDNSAFNGCSSLTSVDIPNSVTTIGYDVFLNCNSLTNINVDAENENYSSQEGVLFNKTKTQLLCYPARKADKNYSIPNSVTSIKARAFYNCSSLKGIRIPDSFTSIDNSAFSNCSSLISIRIPNSVDAIEYYAFEACNSLADVYYGGSETEWNAINIKYYGNSCLTNAAIHYNSEMPYIFKYEQISIASNTYKKSTYNDFLSASVPEFVMPGLRDDVVPQGIAYREDTNQYYISGYIPDKSDNSVIMVIDADTKKYVGEYYLHKKNGDDFTGHAGGIAITKKDLFVTNGKYLSMIPLSDIDALGDHGDIGFTKSIPLALGNAGLSYCNYSNGILWVGNFFYLFNSDYNTPAYSKGLNLYTTLVQGYVMDESTEDNFKSSSAVTGYDYDYVPDYIISAPDRIQGVTTVNDMLVLSQSYGKSNKSTLYTCELPKNTNEVLGEISVGGKTMQVKTWQELDSMRAIPMMEGLASKGNSVYAVFESGASKYRSKATDPTDSVWKIKLNNPKTSIVSDSEADNYPIIVLPGIMGSTLKKDGVLGVPVLTENLDFVDQNDMEIADSIAASTGANDFISALKEDGNTVYACPYDWRLPIDKAAELYLKPLIDRAKKNAGKDKVILVAHSMGGLVSRSYIQSDYYGNDVDALYMLGTPNMGAASIIPLARFGVPYDGSQATVLSYNYSKMTGESYNNASTAEVKAFVNNKIKGAVQLLPEYNLHYYDTNSGSLFGDVPNSFLASLNSSSSIGGKYQKIDGNDTGKVRTMLICADNSETPKAIQVAKKGENYINLKYTGSVFANRLTYMIDAKFSEPYVQTIKSMGDGTVPIESSMGTADDLNSLWTIDRGSYGQHMKMFGSLTGRVRNYLSPNISLSSQDISIMSNISLFSVDDEDIEDTVLLQVDVTGCESADISYNGGEAEDITAGYSLENAEDGEYTVDIIRDEASPRATIQLAFNNGEDMQQEVISFLNDSNSIVFNIENGILKLENKAVTHLRSVNNNESAKLIWDEAADALSYKIYTKQYDVDEFTLIDETTETEYQTTDGWLDDFSESCMNYYVIPVFESGDGGYTTCAHNYNNADASFTYEIDEDGNAQFTDTSTGEITSWEWDFDNDGVVDSTEQNPSYQYMDGVYSVTLTVSGPSGTSVKTYYNIIQIGDYVKSIEVMNESEHMNPGMTKQLKIQGKTVSGETAELDNVSYFSDNEDIAEVDENGLVTANEIGTAYITIVSDDLQTIYEIEINDEPIEYSVSVNIEGNGIVHGTGKCIRGESITLSVEPMEYEEFIGWYDGSDLVSDDEEYTFDVYDNITLTAKFTNNSCKVVLVDGDRIESSMRIKKGEKVIVPVSIEKDGYKFEGYFADEDFTTGFNFIEPISTDTIIYLKYSELEIKRYDDFSYYIDNNEAIITDYSGTDETAYIPVYLEDCPVTTIAYGAFAETDIVSVIVPDTIKQIGGDAFDGCDNLEEILYIGSESEWNDIVIAESNSILDDADKVFDYTEQIVSGYFYIDGNLSDDETKIEYIGTVDIGYCYRDCVAYFEIYNYDTEETEQTFSVNVQKGDETTEFEFDAPADDVQRKITLTFVDNTSDKTPYSRQMYYYFIPQSKRYYDGDYEYAIVNGAAKVTSYNGDEADIIIPSSLGGYTVTGIGNDLFRYSYSYYYIESIILPDTLTYIETDAFRRTQITEIFIPASVSRIDYGAFSGCYKLKEINVAEANSNYTSINGDLYTKDKTELIKYAQAKTDTVFSVPDSVATIHSGALSGADYLETINVPASVKTIDLYAIGYCEALAQINVDEQNTEYKSVDGVLFSSDLKTLLKVPTGKSGTYTVPSYTEIIEEGAFEETMLDTVIIQQSVTTIEPYAFNYSEMLRTILYEGSEEQWDTLIGDDRYCEAIRNANVIYGFNSDMTVVGTLRNCFYDNGKLTANIKLDYISADSNMLLAVYDNSGALIKLTEGKAKLGDNTALIVCDADESCMDCQVKVFFWNNLKTMKPVGNVTSGTITGPVLESDHPYGVNADETQIYTYNGECDSISVTFSDDTATEGGYDYIYIYDVDDNEIGEYEGNQLAGVTVNVPGNTVKIRLVSDESYCLYGYRTTAITVNK